MELENALMAHPGRGRGGGDRGAGRASGASGRWPPWCSRPGAAATAGGAARVPGRAGAALAAARALVVHHRGAQDQRRQVRQDQDPRGVRQRRLRGRSRLAEPCRRAAARRAARADPGSGSDAATALLALGRYRYPGADPLGRREASPSPVYGAALLMRFGFAPIRGSNPRASAGHGPSLNAPGRGPAEGPKVAVWVAVAGSQLPSSRASQRLVHHDQGVSYTLYLMTYGLDSVGDVFGSLFVFAAGLLVIGSGVLPRWLGWASILAGTDPAQQPCSRGLHGRHRTPSTLGAPVS